MLGQWRLAWQLARRFRRGRERSRFLSFISASSTSGIALGCMVFITGLSVMNGFSEVLQERFLKPGSVGFGFARRGALLL